MPVASGELIRMMNYVDDIAATLRRIQGSMGFVTAEERKRLADYMRNANPNYLKIMEALERG
jgi:predicted enzyme related to lactoylglutathione lyase